MKRLNLNHLDRLFVYDYISLASTPIEEICTQAGEGFNDAILECTILAEQIIREKGINPTGTEFFILENYHDFGTYHELAIMYKDGNEEAENYAFSCEILPELWDNEAKKQLNKLGHSKWQDAKIIKLVA